MRRKVGPADAFGTHFGGRGTAMVPFERFPTVLPL